VDADFLQPDGAHMNDDHTWLRWNDSSVSMSGVTQSTNNYVCNLSISPGEIPNLHEDFTTPRKRTGEQMQITLVTCPASLVFTLIFYKI
jgi:hypothetical protein